MVNVAKAAALGAWLKWTGRLAYLLSRRKLGRYLRLRGQEMLLALVRRKEITPDFDLFVRVFEIDFQHLVQQIVVTVQLIQGNLKKLELQVEIHSRRTIQTYQPSMDRDVCILASRTGRIRRTAKIYAVFGYERPVSVENDLLQLPVLPTPFSDPGHMRRLVMAALLSTFRQFRAQALVDQEFHAVRFRRGKRRLASKETLRADGLGTRRGLPLCGFASAYKVASSTSLAVSPG